MGSVIPRLVRWDDIPVF